MGRGAKSGYGSVDVGSACCTSSTVIGMSVHTADSTSSRQRLCIKVTLSPPDVIRSISAAVRVLVAAGRSSPRNS
jgi:hypothetical protein